MCVLVELDLFGLDRVFGLFILSIILYLFSLFMKVNCVVMKGLNDDEIVDFVKLSMNKVSYLNMLEVFKVFNIRLFRGECFY